MSIFTEFNFTEKQKWGIIHSWAQSTQFDRDENTRKIAENAELETPLQNEELGLAAIPTVAEYFKIYVTNHVNAMASQVEAKADEQSVHVGRMLRQYHPELLTQLKTQMGVPDIIEPSHQSLFAEIE